MALGRLVASKVDLSGTITITENYERFSLSFFNLVIGFESI